MMAVHSLRIAQAATLFGLLICADAVRADVAVVQPPFSSGEHFSERDGESLYRAICQGCHMPEGQGASGAGAYPALARNPRLAAKIYPAITIIKGRRAMPAFGEFLDDAQIAAVSNYVRSHFGNTYKDKLSDKDVAALRPAAEPANH